MGLQVSVVRVPKCRRKPLYGHLRRHLGEVFHDLARLKESWILEGYMQSDHAHMLVESIKAQGNNFSSKEIIFELYPDVGPRATATASGIIVDKGFINLEANRIFN